MSSSSSCSTRDVSLYGDFYVYSQVSTMAYREAMRKLRLHQAPRSLAREACEDPEACDVYDTLPMPDLRIFYRYRTGKTAPANRTSCIASLREIDRLEPWNGEYERCSINEMRSFILSRTGKSPPPGDRDSYIAQLRQLDAAVTFRLMDLPLELRQIVYREVIMDVKTTPAQHYSHRLLSVSRRFRAEVLDVVSVDDPPRISLVPGLWNSVITQVRVTGISRLLMHDRAWEKDVQGPARFLEAAEFLQQFPRLVIEIDAVNWCVMAKFSLYTIASVLSVGALRHLRVLIIGKEDIFALDEFRSMLDQLAILDHHVRISLEGFSEGMQAHLNSLRRPQPSILANFIRIRQDVLKLVRRLRRTAGSSVEAVYLSHNLDAVEKRHIRDAHSPDLGPHADTATSHLASYAAGVKARYMMEE